MRILKVYAKETFVELELSMTQVFHILSFLDRSRVEYSSKEEPSMVEADRYVKNDFFRTLEEVYEQFKK